MANKNLNKNNSNIDIVIIRMGWDKGCQNSLFTFRILQCSGAGWHRFSVPSLGAPAQEPRCKVVTVVIMKVQCINPLVLCQTSTCYKGIWVWWLHLIFYMYVDWSMNIDIESRLHGKYINIFVVLADMLELCKRTLWKLLLLSCKQHHSVTLCSTVCLWGIYIILYVFYLYFYFNLCKRSLRMLLLHWNRIQRSVNYIVSWKIT